MIKPFYFYRTPRLLFGAGQIKEVGNIASLFGERVLLVHGAKSLEQSGNLGRILSFIVKAGLDFCRLDVNNEPSPELIDQAVATYYNGNIDVVIAVGGGSVIDAGKAISAMLVSGDEVTQYLEIVGTKKPDGKKVPLIAVPTTAGTGSEASANAVLSKVGANGFKRSLRHDNYVPDIAIVDPELMLFCSPSVTASCGMDALTQLIESYVSPKASPFTDALVESAFPMVKDSLLRAVKNGKDDIDARTGMAYASFVSGITLANAGLGVIHGLASSIGGFFPIPHGVICGSLLAVATEQNIKSLKSHNPDSVALRKYSYAGSVLSGMETASIDEGCRLLTETLEKWTYDLEIKDLSYFGVLRTDIAGILKEGGNKNNPVQLNDGEMENFLLKRI
jgi:alcohol dehydrogenase class IV